MHNPVPVLENDTHKHLWAYDIQTDHLISARFAVPADHRIKLKECEKRDKYLDIARELKKNLEQEDTNNTNCDWCFWHGN